jgi:hypothetical protein
MADYTTAPEVRALETDSDFVTDTSYDALLGALITAASRLIDHYVGGWDNYFYGTASETRYYDGSGEKQQWIDPLVTLTSVAVDESDSGTFTTWTQDTEFIVWPYNYSYVDKPIQRLDVKRDSGKGVWYAFQANVKVIGVFGYSAEPPDTIVTACKIQTARWFHRAKGGFEDSQASAAIGQMFYTQELDPDVKLLLQPYRVGNTAI